MNKISQIIAILVIGIIIVGGGVFFFMRDRKDTTTPAVTETTEQPNTEVEPASPYADGTYTKTGSYTTPGGTEQIELTLELQKGIVSGASVKPLGKAPQSKQFQAKFISGFESQVVGKKIEDLNLTHVSGSSLTPKGFNDAVSKIKVEAQA